MTTGLLHSHVTITIIFILFMLYKNILMLAGLNEKLNAFRSKTKVLDMILGTLLLLTGGGLLFFTKNAQAYMIVKIVILFAVIPLGIVGFKKSNKVLVTLSTLLLFYAFGISKTKSLTFNLGKELPTESTITSTIDPAADSVSSSIVAQNIDNNISNAKAIFTANCAICHGADGKANMNGAKDLTLSKKTLEERIAIISNGKNLMPAFKYQLSEGDIKSLAIYTLELK